MTKKTIPTPICSTCKKSGAQNYNNGETFYACADCGTEMRYLPAGDLLTGGGSEVKKNDGWVTKFSVLSAELSSSRAVVAIGGLVLVLALCFLGLGKIGTDNALWSSGSGVMLVFIGVRRIIKQKKKMAKIIGQYPYWQK